MVCGFYDVLSEFDMSELRYMFRILKTTSMIQYYGPRKAQFYKQVIYDELISLTVPGL